MATDDGTPTGQRLEDPIDRFNSIEDIQRKMQSDKMKKEQEYADLLRQAATRNNQITPSQGFALTALAALPLIVGKHLSGRTRGATALDAGQAGVGGMGQYFAGIEEDDKLRRAAAAQEASNKAGELNIIRSQEASLPGTFIRSQLSKEADDRSLSNNLALIQAKEDARARERAPSSPSESYLNTLGILKEQQVPDPERWAGLSEDEQQSAIRFGQVSGGAERRDRDAEKYAAASNLPDAEPLPGAMPLSGNDRKDIQSKRASFIQLQNGAKTFLEGYRSGDPSKTRTGYSMMSIAMGGPGMGNAGAALSQTEVGRKMGGIPDVLAGGDVSAAAFQRTIGIDPDQLVQETLKMWRGALDEEVKINYKRDAFKAMPDILTSSNNSSSRQERLNKLRAILASEKQGG